MLYCCGSICALWVTRVVGLCCWLTSLLSFACPQMGECHGCMPACGGTSRNKDSYCLPCTTAKRALGQVVVNRRSPQDITVVTTAKKSKFERSEEESRLLNKDSRYSFVETRHKAMAGEPLNARETLYVARYSSQTPCSIVLCRTFLLKKSHWRFPVYLLQLPDSARVINDTKVWINH